MLAVGILGSFGAPQAGAQPRSAPPMLATTAGSVPIEVRRAEPAVPSRDLPGPVGEDRHGYPWSGSRFTGELGLAARIQGNLEGSAAELQRSEGLADPLIVQDAWLHAGNSGRTALEASFDTPTGPDSTIALRYRDFRNFDLEFADRDGTWFDRPSEERSERHLDRLALRFRKFGALTLDVEAEDGHVLRRSPIRDRDEEWTRVALRSTWADAHVTARLDLETLAYHDPLEPADARQMHRGRLRLGRDIAPDTHLQAELRQREDLVPTTGETQRELAVRLSTRTYDLFRLRGLAWRNEVHYASRPLSYQRTSDEEQNLSAGTRLAWNLSEGGGVEIGLKKTWRDMARLDRPGIELLLAEPGTPRAALLARRLETSPSTRDAWLKATMKVRDLAVLTAGLDTVDTDGAPRSDWVRAGSQGLAYTNREGYGIGLLLFPFEGVDLRIDHREDRRFLAGRGVTSQDQETRHDLLELHLHFLPRTDLWLDLGNFDTVHGDGRIQEGTVGETTQYGLRLGYDLARELAVQSGYQRLNHDGVSGVSQEIVTLGFEYGRSGSPLKARLEFTADDFAAPEEPGASYRARVVALSTEARF